MSRPRWPASATRAGPASVMHTSALPEPPSCCPRDTPLTHDYVVHGGREEETTRWGPPRKVVAESGPATVSPRRAACQGPGQAASRPISLPFALCSLCQEAQPHGLHPLTPSTKMNSYVQLMGSLDKTRREKNEVGTSTPLVLSLRGCLFFFLFFNLSVIASGLPGGSVVKNLPVMQEM